MSILESLSELVSGVTGGMSQLPKDFCATAANNSIVATRTKNTQLDAGWKVKRLYYTADFQKIVAATWKVANDAHAQATKFIASGEGDMGGLKAQQGRLAAKGVDGLKYNTAITFALVNNTQVIDAPDLKAWALAIAEEAAKVQWWVAYSHCRQPLLAVALSAITYAIGVLVDVVTAVVEAVVSVASTILSIPGQFAMGWVAIKWAALLGAGGYLLYRGKKAYDNRALPAGESA